MGSCNTLKTEPPDTKNQKNPKGNNGNVLPEACRTAILQRAIILINGNNTCCYLILCYSKDYEYTEFTSFYILQLTNSK